jgi:hypothetical protein
VLKAQVSQRPGIEIGGIGVPRKREDSTRPEKNSTGYRTAVLTVLQWTSTVCCQQLLCSRGIHALAAFMPETYALWLATMYVYASAQESVKRHAKMEQIFQANLTALDSLRSGQKRSKKKAEPKMVAKKMPTKMLYEAMPTKSLLWTVTPESSSETNFCWST